jgi:predicted nucleic acid-binding Zn ribbon protein
MSDIVMGRSNPSRSAGPRVWRAALIVAGLFLGASPLLAATYTVTSISALQSRIDAALAGDVIIVQDGSYTTSAAITVNKAGTSSAPITIKAATTGGVTIGGSNGFSFSSASYIVIQGFRFTHSSAIGLPTGSHHIHFLRNWIHLTIASGADVSYFNISGDDMELGYNELYSKSTLGEMLDVSGSGSQVARRLWVHHNYFHDFTSPGGNGAETIRLGLSGLSMSTGAAIVEHNLFVHCNGENELISNKSSGNTYRYNTFLDSPGAQLTLRHANDCKAYGNYFRNTAGLRVYGDRHQIFSNYFEGNSIGIDMGNGDGEVADGAALTSHDRPDDAVVTFNTFVNNTNHYQMGGRTGGLGALNITVANNIMQGAGNAASISSTAPYTGTWSGNILWNVTTAGNMPSSGYSTVNPMLAADSRGVYHLQSGSPAIDSAVGTYSAVTFDMDGQARSGAKDKGADEVSTAGVSARFLTTAEVGPNAGSSPTPTPTATPTPAPRATPTPAATSTPGSFSGYYRIMARHSGKAVVVQSASTSNSANVVQYTYGGTTTNDEWQVLSIGSGYYRVVNRNSGKDLTVQSASTSDGANIFQYTYGGTTTNDEWAIVDVGSGYYRVTNRNSGKSAEVAAGSTADGANVDQRTYAGATYQQFQLVSVP